MNTDRATGERSPRAMIPITLDDVIKPVRPFQQSGGSSAEQRLSRTQSR